MDNLQRMEKFFKYNLEIKKIIFSVAPKEEYKYSIDSLIEYSDMLEKSINDIEYYITNILEDFNFSEQDLIYFKNFVKAIKNELINSDYDFNKLKNFYEICFSNMNEELVNKVGSEIKGAYLFSGVPLSDAKSINEILHIIHKTIVNNENNYSNLPVIAKKRKNDGNFVTLYGKETDLSKKIFNEFPNTLSSDFVEIMSLSNDRILMMVRDVGHALSIEITKENNMYYINYFIPKICNVKKVNELKGVKKVDSNSNFTVGVFQSSLEDLPHQLMDFISKVPTDSDLVVNYEFEEIKKVK